MTPAQILRKVSRRGALLAALAALLLAAGCDDAIDPAGDEDFVFRTSILDICPEPGGTGSADLTVVVFGPNGDVIEGERVTFDTTAGVVDPDVGRSDKKGKVRATLSAPRTPTLTVTADLKSAGTRSIDFASPGPMLLRGAVPDIDTWIDGDDDGTIEVAKQIFVISPCHVQEISFELSYDPTLLAFREVLNFDSIGAFLQDGGTPVVNDLGGVLDVTLTRDPANGGLTLRGAQILTGDFIFLGLQNGTGTFRLSNVSMTDPLGGPYDVVIGDVAPATVDFTVD